MRGIVWLHPGDPIPSGEPRRYLTGHGYVKLRWKVGVESYVEVLEHRFVMGLPEGEVHHINGVKTDNRPENLEVTTKVAHAKIHGRETAAKARRVTEWEGLRSQYAYDKQQRRLRRERERDLFVARVKELHARGLTTTAIGEAVGRHASGISRIIRGLQ